MPGQQVSGAFGRPTRNARHLDQLRREVQQQWRAVRVLRAEKNSAAARELTALRSARHTERALRELEQQIAALSDPTSRSWQP